MSWVGAKPRRESGEQVSDAERRHGTGIVSRANDAPVGRMQSICVGTTVCTTHVYFLRRTSRKGTRVGSQHNAQRAPTTQRRPNANARQKRWQNRRMNSKEANAHCGFVVVPKNTVVAGTLEPKNTPVRRITSPGMPSST